MKSPARRATTNATLDSSSRGGGTNELAIPSGSTAPEAHEPGPPRLADIAERVGVSEATVSRVLNNRPGVSVTTRRTVLAELQALGYERPRRSQKPHSGLIGVIIPELDDPIFPVFAQAIETALAKEGFTSVLCTQTREGAHEDEIIRLLLARQVAGIVFISGTHANVDTDRTRYTKLCERGLPIVLINGYLKGVDAPFLSNDDGTAVDLALQYLGTLGHTRIGLAAGPERYIPVRRKVAAFTLAHPGDHKPLIAYSAFTVEGGAHATQELLDRGATAVIFGSDVMAMGAIRTARARNLHIPNDFSIVGSEDIPLAEFTEPALTTVRQPTAKMAQAAADALLGEIAGRLVAHAEYIFAPELVIRESTTSPLIQGQLGEGPFNVTHALSES